MHIILTKLALDRLIHQVVSSGNICSYIASTSPLLIMFFFLIINLQGVQLWAGPTFTKYGRFPHQEAKVIEFSPNEKYLVSVTNKEFPPTESRVLFLVSFFLLNIQDHHCVGHQNKRASGRIWWFISGFLLASFSLEQG